MHTQVQELMTEAKARIAEAAAIAANPDASGEDKAKFMKLTAEVVELKGRAEATARLHEAAADIEAFAQKKMPQAAPDTGGFKRLGHFAQAVWRSTFRNQWDRRLGSVWSDPAEPSTPQGGKGWVEDGMERKDLVENIGASGGFLVPLQQMNQLLQVPAPAQIVRPRCTIVPMTARQIQWPVLDQTSTTAGQPHWYGGILARWTEEGETKHEDQPAFRQLNLVAHKLVTYTEASDELLADSGQSIEALLTSLFTGAISWYEEEAFVNGTGAGQPQGVVWAPATIAVGRAVAGAIGLNDLVNMLEQFQGSNGIWLCNHRGLSDLMLLNGPAGNPSYVFMISARDAMPNTLFGMPLFFNEHCPALGVRGDIILADWRMYLVGDRQAFTVDASKHFRFQNDITAWRGVHRVDGRPWLSTPLTWRDGTHQSSPFVVLDSAIAT
jgi:HK97 family phage major capsid protein